MPRPAAKLDAEGLYEKAVRALAQRGRSEIEVRRLLRPRAAESAAIEAVVARLRDHGYLDDARLASAVASYQKDVIHHGRGRVLRELRARGVDAGLAAEAVERGYAGSDEERLLREYVRKKRLRRPEDLRQASSLYRRLLLAGFSPSACQRCLRGWKLDAEWLEAMETIEAIEPGESEEERSL